LTRLDILRELQLIDATEIWGGNASILLNRGKINKCSVKINDGNLIRIR